MEKIVSRGKWHFKTDLQNFIPTLTIGDWHKLCNVDDVCKNEDFTEGNKIEVNLRKVIYQLHCHYVEGQQYSGCLVFIQEWKIYL